jgi:hypothetical protein
LCLVDEYTCLVNFKHVHDNLSFEKSILATKGFTTVIR